MENGNYHLGFFFLIRDLGLKAFFSSGISKPVAEVILVLPVNSGYGNLVPTGASRITASSLELD